MKNQWAIGDIHGCVDTFKTLVESEIAPSANDTIFLLGDLIDRGPDSKAVIDYIISLNNQSVDVQIVRGNHEVMLLEALECKRNFPLWMMNDGMKTLASFGIADDRFTGHEALSEIPDLYIEFFKRLPWYLQTEGFFFVHAGLNPVAEDPLSDTFTMIWTRQEEYNQKFLKGKKLIHGHSPQPLKRILDMIDDPETMVYNLDGGCIYRNYPGMGNLVALNLGTMEVKIVHNRD